MPAGSGAVPRPTDELTAHVLPFVFSPDVGASTVGYGVRTSGRHVRVVRSFAVTAEKLLRQRALRAAVLIDAVRCLLGLAGDHERRIAVRWVLRRDEAPFSFGSVCETLGLPPRRTRRLMLDPALGLDTETFARSLMHRPRRVRSGDDSAHRVCGTGT